MNSTQTDPILAALAKLPRQSQDTGTRARTLTRTLRALAGERVNASRGGNTGSRTIAFFGRWLVSKRLVPAVLSLAGTLYAHGALHQLAIVFGTAPVIESRVQDIGLQPNPADTQRPPGLRFVARVRGPQHPRRHTGI